MFCAFVHTLILVVYYPSNDHGTEVQHFSSKVLDAVLLA